MQRLVTLCLAATLSVMLTMPIAPTLVQAQSCLSRADQRAAIRSGAVMRPGRITRTMRGEVLQVRLCQAGSGLVWQITELGANGRVVGHVIDARTGRRLR